jgi:hypothetical protein
MNKGFKEIMRRQFIRRLIKAGIDPATVDLSKYDFEAFESINDLISYYANLGDPICVKMLSDGRYSGDYIDYVEGRLREYNYRAMIEEGGLDEWMGRVEERLNKLEEDVNKLRRGLEERGLTEKRVEERLKGIEEMITYATRRSVEYTEELRRANDELRERYLDLASKYQGMIALIEKASAQQLNKTKGDALEVKPALPASRGINWKKVAIQVLKGVYLGLICIPLLPFLPILYNNTVVKEAKAMMRKKREKTLMGYLGA